MLAPGDKVERYVVEAVLGRGAMAVVYRVRHSTLRTPHALKVLALSGERMRQRLILEGQVQARLRHPNIVAVTDVLEVDGAPGLLMELVNGPSLDEYLSGRSLGLAEAERIFRGILAGVREAHAQGALHRDLKPANVIMTSPGAVPKVADFGLAKLVADEDGSAVAQTRAGTALGTPAYMAPEQIRDAANVDQRADIFSLGCVLYELLAGQRAFAGDDLLDVFNRVCNGQHEPLPDVPARFQRAIIGCLQVQRDARIPSCDALVAVLDEKSLPIPALLAPPAFSAGGTEGTFEASVEQLAAAAPVSTPVPSTQTLSLSIGDAMMSSPSISDALPPAPSPAPEPAPSLETRPTPDRLAAVSPRLEAAEQPTQRPGRRWIPGSILGALAIAATVALWSAGSDPAPLVTDPPAALPASASTTPPATPSTAMPASAVPPTAAPPAAVAPPAAQASASAAVPTEARKNATARPSPAMAVTPATVAATPVATTPVTASPPTALGVGMLKVRSVPYSNVSLDGAPGGHTPFSREITAGRHDLVLVTADNARVERTLTVRASETSVFCWDFEINAECN